MRQWYINGRWYDTCPCVEAQTTSDVIAVIEPTVEATQALHDPPVHERQAKGTEQP